MSKQRTIYLDHNATTPLDARVRQAMLEALDQYPGNPSSIHQLGRKARVFLDQARERACAILGCQPSELIFTSGGTESLALGIAGTARRLRERGRHLITSATEHHAVLHTFRDLERREGFQVTVLPVDAAGRVAPEDLASALRPDTTLVSVMAANNETGTLQRIGELARICREHPCLLHTDAIQWCGKVPFARVSDMGADLVSICGHKIYGPKGIGALYSRSGCQPEALLVGGPQELERRAGTENLAAISGFVIALEQFCQPPVFDTPAIRSQVQALRQIVADRPGVQLVGDPNERLPNTVGFTVEGADSLSLVAALDLEGICVSSGSACSSGSLQPSHVLLAMGIPPHLAQSFVRFSLGRDTLADDVSYAGRVFCDVIERIRIASGYAE